MSKRSSTARATAQAAGRRRRHGGAAGAQSPPRVAPALDPFEGPAQDYESRSPAHAVVGLPEQLDAPGLWRGVGYRVGKRTGWPPVSTRWWRSSACRQ